MPWETRQCNLDPTRKGSTKEKVPFFSRVGQYVVGFEPALVATGPEEFA